jgi:hypothetical protein
MLPKPISKEDILRAMRVTKSNRSAARYFNCSYQHSKKFAKILMDETSGKSLFELHKNQAGRGINKFMSNKGKEPALQQILSGELYIESYSVHKLKSRLIQEAILPECCSKCGFNEQRVTDYRVPLLLNFKDSNKKNWKRENLDLYCYNCYFLLIGDVYSNKQILSIEDYVDQPKTAQVDWEMDEHYREHLKQLGLIDEKSDGEEFIAYD